MLFLILGFIAVVGVLFSFWASIVLLLSIIIAFKISKIITSDIRPAIKIPLSIVTIVFAVIGSISAIVILIDMSKVLFAVSKNM